MAMKKNNFIPGWLLLFGFIFLAMTACNKNEDLVTEDALEGGLVEPTAVFNFKLGSTTTVEIPITIPVGPAIGKIEVYKSYYSTTDTAGSNEVLHATLTNIGGTVPLSLTYADLKKDLLIKGAPLPDDETLLGIGSAWTLSYVAYMAEDGRKVVNNAKTKIAVANAYAAVKKISWNGAFYRKDIAHRELNR